MITDEISELFFIDLLLTDIFHLAIVISVFPVADVRYFA